MRRVVLLDGSAGWMRDKCAPRAQRTYDISIYYILHCKTRKGVCHKYAMHDVEPKTTIARFHDDAFDAHRLKYMTMYKIAMAKKNGNSI